ncbi:MAG: CGNR zinc finger domain-containing protein [Nonomuraea sp.]|nr:CGNR zinc finger domain-containing protein [Nonomuraea sp.]NUT41857.1 CGNR zinc finger domain-containing protein [Thermoactinospora sp.]
MRQFAETGVVAIDLANTWDEYLDDPERLPDAAELRRFRHELGDPDGDQSDGDQGDGDQGDGDLRGVREVRARLREVLAEEPAGRARALAEWVAELPLRAGIEEAGGVPRLRLVAPEGAAPALRLAVRAVTELLEIAGSGDWERLRQCAATPCTDAFVDRSRPGRRQFCSTRCANRAHAQASRARRPLT